MSTDNVGARWEVGIWTECPNCGHHFDILADSAECITFKDCPVLLCEQGTPRTTGIETHCPECEHDYKVDLEY